MCQLFGPENVNQCFVKRLVFVLDPKILKCTVTEEDRKQEISTFKALESETLDRSLFKINDYLTTN